MTQPVKCDRLWRSDAIVVPYNPVQFAVFLCNYFLCKKQWLYKDLQLFGPLKTYYELIKHWWVGNCQDDLRHCVCCWRNCIHYQQDSSARLHCNLNYSEGMCVVDSIFSHCSALKKSTLHTELYGECCCSGGVQRGTGQSLPLPPPIPLTC